MIAHFKELMKKTMVLTLVAFFVAACSLPTPSMPFAPNGTPSPIAASPTTSSAIALENSIQCMVVASNLNLRRAAGTSAPVAVVLNNGDVVTIDQDTPAQNSWRRVYYGDLAGWINTNFCK